MPAPERVVLGSRACSPWSRCLECNKKYSPSPRLKLRQKTCGELLCRRKHRARYRRRYRSQNPEVEQESRKKIQTNRPNGFWKNYRKEHSSSTERNRKLTKLRKRLARSGLQRQLDIVQVVDPPGYFDLFRGFATSHRSLIEECRAKRAA
jgi:hypothetical protein